MRRSPRLSLSFFLLIGVFALIAASCGDSDTASDESSNQTTSTTLAAEPTTDDPPASDAATTTTAAPQPLTASFRGVTADSIHVGVMAVDWDTLADIGVRFGRTNSGDLYEAAIAAVNERGGINGRMLEVTVEYFLPVGSQSFDEGCTRLTQDEEIFVVIGQALDDTVLCFVELNDTAAVVVTGMTEELEARATAPYATIWASLENRADRFVALMEETGALDDATIGVIGSVDVSEIEYQTIVDGFVRAGYEVVEGLISGNAEDIEATNREQQLIFERMRTEGVDVTVSTTGVPLEIANAANASYDAGQWMLATLVTEEGLTDEGVDLAYLDGALGVTNTAVGTTAQPDLANDPVASACVADLVARTGRELPYSLDAESNDLTAALYACAEVAILEQGLLAAGADLTNASFQAGLDSIGDIDLAGHFEGLLEAGDLGAARGLLMVQFDAAAGVWMPIEG